MPGIDLINKRMCPSKQSVNRFFLLTVEGDGSIDRVSSMDRHNSEIMPVTIPARYILSGLYIVETDCGKVA